MRNPRPNEKVMVEKAVNITYRISFERNYNGYKLVDICMCGEDEVAMTFKKVERSEK